MSAIGLIPLIPLLYVDDILLFSESPQRVSELRKLLHAEYKMTDLGPIRQFLGLEIERDPPEPDSVRSPIVVYRQCSCDLWAIRM